MRILIENGTYSLQNLGDVSMFLTAVKRLKERFASAELFVPTAAPELLRFYCPEATPVRMCDRTAWFREFLPARSRALIGDKAVATVNQFVERLRVKAPRAAASLLAAKQRLRRKNPNEATSFVDTLREMDGVVVSGGGHLADCFEWDTLTTLDLLETAMRLGKWTAMLGQGIGPLKNQRVFHRAKSVLPRVDFISLREKRECPRLLGRLGMTSSSLTITGDDAIEMAHTRRRDRLENGIGVNFRLVDYSGMTEELIGALQPVVWEQARTHGAPLFGVPISIYPGEDKEGIQSFLKGYTGTVNDGGHVSTPQDTIQQVSQCRVVLTSSYHAGVFALAQGIPAICLAKSQYYKDKFLGLADMFGVGCEVILVSGQDVPSRVEAALNSLWSQAEALRPTLLEAASRQIARSQAAHERFFELVESKDVNKTGTLPNLAHKRIGAKVAVHP